MLTRRLLLLLVAILGSLVLAGWYGWSLLHRPVHLSDPGVVVSVPPGASFASVARRLERAGVLRHPRLLGLWARYQGTDRLIRSGEYHFNGSVSAVEVLALLQSPTGALRRVTFPEGLTAEGVARVLEEAGFGGRDVFREAMHDPEMLADLDLPRSGVEGFLFPDTYAFEWAMEPEDVIRAMVDRFRQESAALTAERIRSGLTELEMVTLASVIEKETGREEERALISGVFHNRLRIGMPLQSDPTVVYARPRGLEGPITRADLARDSDYNTYLRRGLPPGPIANPGRAALTAAIHPEKTDALYFVARNDGSHEFSSSLAAHNRAVRRYQRRHRVDD